jgi:hypothetical protein
MKKRARDEGTREAENKKPVQEGRAAEALLVESD